MIQRIQSIYILLSVFLIGLVINLPLADIAASGELFVFKAKGILLDDEVIVNGLPIMILSLLIILLHLVAFFLYKKRIRQIRILVFTIVLMLGIFGLFYYFAYSSFEEETVSFKIPVAFPLVAIILDYLAIRGIGKDEALVRSLNRIR